MTAKPAMPPTTPPTTLGVLGLLRPPELVPGSDDEREVALGSGAVGIPVKLAAAPAASRSVGTVFLDVDCGEEFDV